MVLAMIETWFVVKEGIKVGEKSPLNILVIGQCVASVHAAFEGTTCDHFHQLITLLLMMIARLSLPGSAQRRHTAETPLPTCAQNPQFTTHEPSTAPHATPAPATAAAVYTNTLATQNAWIS